MSSHSPEKFCSPNGTRSFIRRVNVAKRKHRPKKVIQEKTNDVSSTCQVNKRRVSPMVHVCNIRPLLQYKQGLYTTEAATITKCPNKMNNRALGTIETKTIVRENNGE